MGGVWDAAKWVGGERFMAVANEQKLTLVAAVALALAVYVLLQTLAPPFVSTPTQAEHTVLPLSAGSVELELQQSSGAAAQTAERRRTAQEKRQSTRSRKPSDVTLGFSASGILPADAVKLTKGRAQHLASEAKLASRSGPRPLEGAWEDHPACMVTSAVLKHTIKAISAAELLDDPFPYVYIKNVFEPKFYEECVLDRLPLARHTRTVYRRDVENARRFAIEMKPRLGLGHSVPVNDTNRVFQKANATLVDQRFWKDFTGNFTSPAVIEALVKKFDRVLALRKPEYAETMDQFYFNMALTRDVAGYRVDAHTDPAARWISMLFYLPATPKYPKFGTLVIKSDTPELSTGRMELGSPGFKTAFQAQFVPNSLLAFAPCSTAWHGVATVKSAGRIHRDTIQGYIRSRVYGARTPKAHCA